MLELKITTLVIEKDKKSLNETLAVLDKFNELSVVAGATSGKQGLALGKNFIPQLTFITIDLPDTTGLELLRTIRSRTNGGNFVLLAKDSRDAFSSLPLEPFDYLIKPIDPVLIKRLIIRLKQNFKKKELLRKMDKYTKMQSIDDKRIFHQKKGIVVLKVEEIVFCKAELTRTSLKLQSGENILVKSNLSETLEIINHKEFVRTGRSYYINRQYLRKIDKKNLKCELYYQGQTWYVPVSKNTIGNLEKLNVHLIY